MIQKLAREQWNNVNYNSLSKPIYRILAKLIDLVVLLPLFIIKWYLEANDITIWAPVITSFAIITYIVILTYRTGGTIGKQQTELRVQKLNGSRISIRQSIAREFLLISFGIIEVINTFYSITDSVENNGLKYLVEKTQGEFLSTLTTVLVILTVLDIIFLFANKEKRTLRDMFANTICRSK